MCFQCCVIVIVCTSESECVKVCLCGGGKKKTQEDISGSFSFTAACPLRGGGGHRERREGGEARHVVVAWGGRGVYGGVNLFK